MPFPVGPESHLIDSFAATLTASPSCAATLPEAMRVRSYTAEFWSDGTIHWKSPTLTVPMGHDIVSGETAAGSSFSMFIGTKEDPQSDAFHGLTEDFGATILNIAGDGTGTISGGLIKGTLSGDFNYYEVDSSGVQTRAIYCSAPDHAFVLDNSAVNVKANSSAR